jgi:CHAT domain-containing protein
MKQITVKTKLFLRVVIGLGLITSFVMTHAQTARRGSGDLVQLMKQAELREEPSAPDECSSSQGGNDEGQQIAALKTCIALLENLGRWPAQKNAYQQLSQLLQNRPKVEQLNLLQELSNKMRRYDNPVKAMAIKRDILNDPAATNNQRVVQHQGLAIDGALVFFDPAMARHHLNEMETINRQRRSALRQEFVDLMDATTAGARAAVLLSEGDYAGAEKNYDKYISGYQQYLTQIPRLEREFRVDSPDAVRGYIYTGRSYQVETLLRAGDLDRAELQARALLKDQLGVLSAGSPLLARSLNLYGRVLIQQGRFREAQYFNAKALSALERSGVEPQARIKLQSQATQIDLGMVNGDWALAYATWESYRSAKTISGEPPLFEPAWVVVLNRAGKPELALQESTQAWQRAQRLPPTSKLRAEVQAFHAMALTTNGQHAQAADLARESVPRLIELLSGANTQGHEFLRIKLLHLLDGLAPLVNAQEEIASKAQDAVWELSEAVKFTSVHKAVAFAAARSTRNQQLKELIREEQDLSILTQNLAKAIENLEALVGESDGAVLERLKEKLQRTETARADVLKRIQTQEPAYFQLLGGGVAGADKLATVLRPNESYVSITPTQRGVLVLAINEKKQRKAHFADLPTEKLKELSRRLRATVDFSAAKPGMAVAPFDFETAHLLYQKLLSPIASIFAGKGLMIASVGGELATLPLGLWTTATFVPALTPIAYASYQQAPWLASSKDISYVPSATALVALRDARERTSAPEPFVGFGDPDFAVQPKVQETSADAVPTRASQRVLRLADADLLSLNPLPDSMPAIPALPETREEVTSIAKMLQSDPSKSLYLGGRASRSNALHQDLSRYRMLAFATHGLIPGDVPGLNQPALAMSTSDPSGFLLTAQDILNMRLNADWVILSACNSGAAEGAGAEALTGLGRSFFYAGSRAIYVTQWPVESESAKQLVIKTIELFQAQGMGRAEAANAAMRHVMANGTMILGQQKISYAHPSFWAPYMLVGEPTR